MSSFIFADAQANHNGSLCCIANTGTDISSYGNGYKIIACTDEQFNSVKLEKKAATYDDSNALVLTDYPYIWPDITKLQEAIDALATSDDHPANKTCVEAVKTKDFSGESFPLNKSIPQLAEEKGISWTAMFEI